LTITTVPDSGQVVGDWQITSDGKDGFGSGEGTFSGRFRFETSGVRKWKFSGSWTDKDGKTSTYFKGETESPEFKIFEIQIVFAPLYMCKGKTDSILTKINPEGINRNLVWSIIGDTSGGATVDQNGNVTAGRHKGNITVKVCDSVFTNYFKTCNIEVVDGGMYGLPERALCAIPINASKCLGSSFLRDSAYAWATNNYKVEELRDGYIGNAALHAYWSCLVTQAYGSDWAKAIGNAHESFPKNPCEHQSMDLHNNAIGRKLGSQSDDCGQKVKEAEDELFVLYK